VDEIPFSSSSQAPGLEDASRAENALWRRWHGESDIVARDELIRTFLPFARVIAASTYAQRTHDDIAFDEYLQLSSVGLIEAVDRYDPAGGAQFKTFAAHRMRGAVLNGLKNLTEKNQQIALRIRLRKERVTEIKSAAREDEAIPHVAEDPTSPKAQDALLRFLTDVGIGLALSILLEDTGMVLAQDPADRPVAPSPEIVYFQKTGIMRLQDQLRELVDRLTDQERRVVRYHYYQELPFDEISVAMEVTRGRVSQLHRQAIAKLRKLVAKGPPCDVCF